MQRALPASRPAATVPGDETRPDPRAAVRGARVLVVEDSAINRERVVHLLGAAGVVVSVACDGQEALEQLDRQPFDAVPMAQAGPT